MTSADSSARPSDESRPVRRLHDRRWVVLLSILTLLVGSGVGALVLHATGAFAAQIMAGPIQPPGENSFVPPVRGNQLKVTSPPSKGRRAPDRTLGLYGGTLDNSSCDSQTMVAFLQVHPDKAAAWASVEGITPAKIPAYVADLIPVILRADTAVTTHGFSDGKATNVPAVLHAGTAILVDKFGVPRTLCYCGNPLTSDAVISKFVNDCETGVVRWRAAQVYYPARLSLDMNQSAAYVVAVDIHDNPLLPTDKIFVMPGTDPQSAPIEVQCVLSARPVPIGPSLEVDNKDWITREFTPSGYLNWSWSVTARAAHDQEIQLELQPAVTTQDMQVLFEGGSSPKTRAFITQVHVNATRIQLANQWWNDSGKIIVAITVSFLTALVSIIKWGGNLGRAVRSALAELRGKQKKDDRPET